MIEQDPLAVSMLLDDLNRERRMYHQLVYDIRHAIGDDGIHAQLLDLPRVIAEKLAAQPLPTTDAGGGEAKELEERMMDVWCSHDLAWKARFMLKHPDGLDPVIAAIRAHYTPRPDPIPTREAPPSGWRPISSAQKSSEWIVGKMADGDVRRVHYAEDLSGSEQPAFQGWFYEAGHSFHGCSPVYWMPDPPVPSTPEEEG